jgi:hypothetical protein
MPIVFSKLLSLNRIFRLFFFKIRAIVEVIFSLFWPEHRILASLRAPKVFDHIIAERSTAFKKTAL